MTYRKFIKNIKMLDEIKFDDKNWEGIKREEFKEFKKTSTFLMCIDAFQRFEFDNYFINSKKIKRNSGAIEEIIKTRKLEKNKQESAKTLLKELNKKNTMVAIMGKNGSGKSTVLDLARKAFSVENKLMNWITLFLLYILLFFNAISLSWVISGSRTTDWINKKISIYRSSYIHINVWNLFGMRNNKDYKDMESAYSNSRQKNEKHIETYYENKEKNGKASYLFVKRTIWKTILHKYDSKKFIYNKIKSSLTFEKRKPTWLKIMLYLIMFLILIIVPLSITIPFIALNDKFMDGESYEITMKVLLNVLPPCITMFISIILLSKKHIKKSCSNKFLADPSNNALMIKMLEKMSKRRFLIIHFSEIDRLNSWIKKDGEVNDSKMIGNIIEQIALLYGAGKLNIVVELTPSLIGDWQKEREVLNLEIGDGDTVRKLFSEIIEVSKISLASLLIRITSEHKNNLENMKRSFLSYWFNYLESKNAISWRNEEYLVSELKYLADVFYKTDLQYLTREDLVEFMELLFQHFIKRMKMLGDNNNKEYKDEVKFILENKTMKYNFFGIKPKTIEDWKFVLGTLTVFNNPEIFLRVGNNSRKAYNYHYQLRSVFKSMEISEKQGWDLWKEKLSNRKINIGNKDFNYAVQSSNHNLNDMFEFMIEKSKPIYFWKNDLFTKYIKTLPKRKVKDLFKYWFSEIDYYNYMDEIIDFGMKNSFAIAECKKQKNILEKESKSKNNVQNKINDI